MVLRRQLQLCLMSYETVEILCVSMDLDAHDKFLLQDRRDERYENM